MSFPRYPEYKESGVEWLGDIPSQWNLDRLKRSTFSCKNGVWGSDPLGNGDDITCVRVADFDRIKLKAEISEPTIRNVPPKDRTGRTLRKGDLLLEKSGGGEQQPVGCVVLYDDTDDAVCSNFVAKIELASGMIASYWRYFHAAAYAVRLNTRSIKQTSGIQNLDQQQYLDELAAFPPAAEQQMIAAFLDRETAKIDELAAQQRRLIELLKEKRQAVISHAVTKGPNPDAPLKPSGIEWLGDVPEHWEVARLKHLIMPGTSISYGIVQPGEPLQEGVPFVQTTNMSTGNFTLDALQKTSEAIAMQYPRSCLVGGEVLLGIRASIGASHIAPAHLAGANLSRGVARIVPNPQVVASFVARYLGTEPVAWYWQLSKQGSTFNEVSIETVRNLSVPVPPLDEQNMMVDAADEAATELNDLIHAAERAIALLQERRTALISAAVTGKIDVRGLAATEAA